MPAEALLSTLRHVWRTLQPLNLPMAVMGGLALATWKHVRATRDIDLLLGIGETELNLLLQTLAAADIRPKREPPVITLGNLRVIQLLYEPPDTFMPLQVDLLLATSAYHRAALARRISTPLADLDLEITVLTCEDLLLHKLLAGRMIDRADAAALLRANRNSLDLNYLAHWIGTLELTPALTEVWKEAFPAESLPQSAHQTSR